MKSLPVAVILGVLVLGAAAPAAEIELGRECRPAASIVRLGDVAKIHTADAREAAALAALELFPTPPAGQQRPLRVRELQDLLLLRGVALAQHRLSGSSQVLIHGAEERAEGNRETLSIPMLKKAERQVAEAVAHALSQAAGRSEKWAVAVSLEDAQARLVSKAQGNLSVTGGAAPWVGRQTFEVSLAGSREEKFSVEAQVSLPLSVVVATHSLPRGALIGPSDVRLEPGTPSEAQSDCFHTLDEVVGCETTQTLAEGAVVQKRSLHTPRLVHRGEIVTVYARAAGITVRTAARVREEGSLGDLVSVESLADRKAFIARVCGIRELEVFARAPQAESTPTR